MKVLTREQFHPRYLAPLILGLEREATKSWAGDLLSKLTRDINVLIHFMLVWLLLPVRMAIWVIYSLFFLMFFLMVSVVLRLGVRVPDLIANAFSNAFFRLIRLIPLGGIIRTTLIISSLVWFRIPALRPLLVAPGLLCAATGLIVIMCNPIISGKLSKAGRLATVRSWPYSHIMSRWIEQVNLVELETELSAATTQLTADQVLELARQRHGGE